MDRSPLDRPDLRPFVSPRRVLLTLAVYGTMTLAALSILAGVVALASPPPTTQLISVPEIHFAVAQAEPTVVEFPPPVSVAIQERDDDQSLYDTPPAPPAGGPRVWVGCELSVDVDNCANGLPAISADGKLIAFGEWDSTNADYAGFTIHFIDTATSKIHKSFRLFETEELPGEDVLRQRATAPQTLLDDGGFVSMTPLIDGAGLYRHPTLVPWVHGDAVGIRDRASGWSRYQRLFEIEKDFGPEPSDDDPIGCYPGRIYKKNVWIGPDDKHAAFVAVGFDMGCVCGEEQRYFTPTLAPAPDTGAQ